MRPSKSVCLANGPGWRSGGWLEVRWLASRVGVKKNAEGGSGPQAAGEQLLGWVPYWRGGSGRRHIFQQRSPISRAHQPSTYAPGSWPQHVPCKILCNQPVQRGSEGIGWHLCLPSLEMSSSVSFLCRQKTPGLTHPPTLAFGY